MAKVLLERKDVDEKFTWDLTAIFKTEEEFDQTVKEAQKLTEEVEEKFKGKLNTAEAINECLNRLRKVYQLTTLTGSYSYLAVAVDQTNVENQERRMNYPTYLLILKAD